MPTCRYCGVSLNNPRAQVCAKRECRNVRKAADMRRYKLAKKLRTLDPDRKCEGCGRALPVSLRADARHCSKVCIERRRRNNGERANYIKENQARSTATMKAWRLENPAKFAVHQALKRGVGEDRIFLVSEKEWLRLIRRYHGQCAYCRQSRRLFMDHVLPFSRGGRHCIGNLLPTCADCNARKHAKLLIVFRQQLVGGPLALAA